VQLKHGVLLVTTTYIVLHHSILLTNDGSSEVHTERVVVLPLQQWLREREAVLRRSTLSILWFIRMFQTLRRFGVLYFRMRYSSIAQGRHKMFTR